MVAVDTYQYVDTNTLNVVVHQSKKKPKDIEGYSKKMF